MSEQQAPKLSPKQRAFVEHYLQCWNGTEAARRAGYSARTANEQAAQLLAKLSIQALIQERVKELKADADEVLLRLADHARGTIEDFIDDADELSLKQARERRKLHLVKKLKQTTRYDKDGGRYVTVEAELYDAQAATVQLGRALGLFVDKTALTDPTGRKEYAGLSDDERAARIAALLDAARARRAGSAPGDDGPAAAA